MRASPPGSLGGVASDLRRDGEGGLLRLESRDRGRCMLRHTNTVDALGRDERHRQFGALLEFSPDAIVMVDRDGLVRECNPAAERMLERAPSPGAHLPLRDLLCAAHRETLDIAWQQLLDGHPVPRATASPESDVRSALPLDVTVAPIWSEEELAGAVVILRDATGLHGAPPVVAALAEAHTVADGRASLNWPEFDSPAGLPGRRWLHRHLSERYDEGSERGVAVFDIDAFAMVISTYGPDAADDVLTRFGDLLQVARHAGDVFASGKPARSSGPSIR